MAADKKSKSKGNVQKQKESGSGNAVGKGTDGATGATGAYDPHAKRGFVLTRKHEKILTAAFLIILALYFVTAFIAYPMMPDIMPTHWGMNGEVNSYADKTLGVFGVPVTMVIVVGLIYYLKRYDHRRRHKSRLELERYDAGTAGLVLLITLFMYVIYVYTLLYALGMYQNMTYLIFALMIPLFSGMFWFFNQMDVVKLGRKP